MDRVQSLVAIGVVLASTLPAWLPAQGVELPESMRPEAAPPAARGYTVAQSDEFDLKPVLAGQRGQAPPSVEIVGADQRTRTISGNTQRPTPARPHNTTRPATVAPQAIISDTPVATSAAAGPQAEASRKSPGGKNAPMASALYPEWVARKNPYGEINDTRGLRPYNPGVRYDREQDERDSSVFGRLFGR